MADDFRHHPALQSNHRGRVDVLRFRVDVVELNTRRVGLAAVSAGVLEFVFVKLFQQRLAAPLDVLFLTVSVLFVPTPVAKLCLFRVFVWHKKIAGLGNPAILTTLITFWY